MSVLRPASQIGEWIEERRYRLTTRWWLARQALSGNFYSASIKDDDGLAYCTWALLDTSRHKAIHGKQC